MVDFFPSPMKPVGDTLVLVFDHGRPLEAEELGRLFSSLAKDYRQFTRGRTLVIERLETGSFIAYLRDAVEAVRPYLTGVEDWAKAGAALADFAKAIKNLLTRAKEDPENAGFFEKGRKRAGTRSVEALLQIATESGSEVTVRHFASSSGETMEIQVTPVEALRVREAAEAKRLDRIASEQSALARLKEPQLEIPDFKAASFARALADLSGSDDGSFSPEVRLVIQSMIRMLRKKGLSFVIEGIAADLEQSGRRNLAFVVRQEAARP